MNGRLAKAARRASRGVGSPSRAYLPRKWAGNTPLPIRLDPQCDRARNQALKRVLRRVRISA